MHKRFMKNLSKLLIVAITIPSTPINLAANTVYEKEININQSAQTTTGSSLEIIDTNETTMDPNPSLEIAEVDQAQETTTMAALSVRNLDGWDGVSMSEPAFEEGTYLVTSAEEFKWLEDAANTGSLETTDITISVQNDIDFNNHSVTIGSKTYPYMGKFIGNGYTLYNLDFTNTMSTTTTYIGLFGYTDGVSFSNINIEATLAATKYGLSKAYGVGCLTGYAKNIEYVKDINLNLTVKNNKRNIDIMGGLVGEVSNVENLYINNVNVDINIESSLGSDVETTYFGGVIGKIDARWNTCNTEITNSDVKISASNNRSCIKYLSGFIGDIAYIDGDDTSFIANNLNIDLDIYCSFYGLNGIISSIDDFNYVDLSDCDVTLDVEGNVSSKYYTSSSIYGERSNYSGCLTGYVHLPKGGTINMTDCQARGSVVNLGPAGLINTISGGYESGVNVSNCTSYVDLIDIPNGGGIITKVNGFYLNVENCENHGNINSYVGDFSTKDGKVGGIIAYIYGNADSELPTTRIKDCTNYGTIVGFSRSGGIVGSASLESMEFENCKMLGSYGLNTSIFSGGYTGGILGISSSGKTTIFKNCYVDVQLINPNGDSGGITSSVSGSNIVFDGNEIVGHLENTMQLDNLKKDYSFCGLSTYISIDTPCLKVCNNKISDISLEARGNYDYYSGLIGRLNSYDKDSLDEHMTFENNTLSNITYTSDGSSNPLICGMIGNVNINSVLDINKNVLENISLKSNNEYSSILIGQISGLKNSFGVNVKNNLIQGTIDSEVELADLISYIKCSLDFAGNLVLVEGDNLNSGYSKLEEEYRVKQSAPNYYNKDLRVELDEPFFTPLSTDELKEMKNFAGFDFDNTWGFSDEYLDHPILTAQNYSVEIGEPIDLFIEENGLLNIKVSHPSILSSISVEIEDESILTLDGDKIVPLKEGTTNIVVSSNDLPLNEQLQTVQRVTVKDLIPKLDLENITVNEGEPISDVNEFIASFSLQHPFDDELINDITENANYEIISVRDSKGIEATNLDKLRDNYYTVTIKATYNDYTTTKEVKLNVQKVMKEIQSIKYDDSKLTVDFGTEFNNLKLPNNVYFTYWDEEVYEMDQLVWEANDYDPSNPGEYILSATITLPDDFNFNGSQEVALYKTVEVLDKKY